MILPSYEQDIRLTELRAESAAELHELFVGRTTVDAWQHERMVKCVTPLAAAYPGASWLTVGDSVGLDAWLLQAACGVRNVSASSISDARLRKAKELGFLDGIAIRAINAEQIDLADSAVDFLLCKQAYHHFPRPPVAFYEFMRVARIGLVLIEPAESPTRPLDILRMVAKVLLRRRRPAYEMFEPVGNYIYRISERDIFRMLAALHLRWFAIKTFNNFNSARLAKWPRDSRSARLIFQVAVGVQDVLVSSHLISPGLCVVFVPTGPDAESAQATLRASDFKIVTIPENPYAAADYVRPFLP